MEDMKTYLECRSITMAEQNNTNPMKPQIRLANQELV